MPDIRLLPGKRRGGGSLNWNDHLHIKCTLKIPSSIFIGSCNDQTLLHRYLFSPQFEEPKIEFPAQSRPFAAAGLTNFHAISIIHYLVPKLFIFGIKILQKRTKLPIFSCAFFFLLHLEIRSVFFRSSNWTVLYRPHRVNDSFLNEWPQIYVMALQLRFYWNWRYAGDFANPTRFSGIFYGFSRKQKDFAKDYEIFVECYARRSKMSVGRPHRRRIFTLLREKYQAKTTNRMTICFSYCFIIALSTIKGFSACTFIKELQYFYFVLTCSPYTLLAR